MRRDYQIVVLGGGSGGISAARAAKRAGLSVAMVQDGPIGGECTFSGCVPSKVLIEAARQGLPYGSAHQRLKAVIAEIAEEENKNAFLEAGIDVFEARGRLGSEDGLLDTSLGVSLRYDHLILATGSTPMHPFIPGPSERYLTNENVFELVDTPKELVVVGGGAIGCELAQAYRRYGSKVTVLELSERLLPAEDYDASMLLGTVFRNEGIETIYKATVSAVREKADGTLELDLSNGDRLSASHILLATGRSPSTSSLNLEENGVSLDERGYVKVDRHLRTSKNNIYAVGDVTGIALLTHAADEMGRIAVHNITHPLRKRSFHPLDVPIVIFTDPEYARIGPSPSSIPNTSTKTVTFEIKDSDRAKITGRREGFIKLTVTRKSIFGYVGGGRVLSATIIGDRASELIHEVELARRSRMFAGRLAQTVHAYPSSSIALRQCAAKLFP
ncbi:Pyruvate/2-oxoglutarate dehydrogenase complex, dihydrolipoamide dehydrogenase (E3) component [Ferrithrix thermotolerans DSM 19514]|uniref:Pyruvate/2-oxoglutarate dehydrogenase complex, dihydrolipoamide dehydrogenase (E3) component n=1 Tax=Ferrithrix thermotolerans DSM 19514 TaxID=1121881 RepID=A0A1M4XPU7_9ACTN|nr:NAD(P)/FAD-dependent oxidoreductase [Ferrithrix thermotolerans]SHE95458.1 Pyruvate/2-oxoglutarate dehydrogenase complex, dihydrolipoamide dehydrogenase (E3) component [Ferrithrix thermotolerans DSM 19514]